MTEAVTLLTYKGQTVLESTRNQLRQTTVFVGGETTGITLGVADSRYVRLAQPGVPDGEVLTAQGGITVWKESTIKYASTNW